MLRCMLFGVHDTGYALTTATRTLNCSLAMQLSVCKHNPLLTNSNRMPSKEA
jgi:hypothetical protein